MVKIVDQSFEIIEELNPIKRIEMVARTCYQSWDYTKQGSAETLIRKLIKNDHTAMLEHANLIVKCYLINCHKLQRIQNTSKYLRHSTYKHTSILSGNVRAFREYFVSAVEEGTFETFDSDLLEFFRSEYLVLFEDLLIPRPKTMYNIVQTFDIIEGKENLSNYGPDAVKIHYRPSVRFIVDRGVTHELVRHRIASFAQESSRYNDYSKNNDKPEIVVIRPTWAYDINICNAMIEFVHSYGRGYDHLILDYFHKLDYFYNIVPIITDDESCFDNSKQLNQLYAWTIAMIEAETNYNCMRKCNLEPQFARSSLPIGIKSEIVCTANIDEWNRIFDLRCSDTAHPSIHRIMDELDKEFMERKIL